MIGRDPSIAGGRLGAGKGRRAAALAGAALLGAAALLTGCQGGLPIFSRVKEVEGYPLNQAMIVAATERNCYQEAYTDQLWDAVLDEEGTTAETFLLRQVEVFLKELKLVSQMAEEQGIGLDGEEQALVAQLAEEYYSGLTEGDLAYLGVTQEDVEILYGDYALADKAVTELTGGADLEVSDSEAKVIGLQQIEVWDEATAERVWALTQEEGANFVSIAREYSVNPEIQRKLARGEGGQALEEAAFALAEGEVSGVIQSGQVYYIVKCVDDYDEEATRERKGELELLKKEQAFQEIYGEYESGHTVVFGENFWDGMDFDGGADCTTTNFFELYREYFPR